MLLRTAGNLKCEWTDCRLPPRRYVSRAQPLDARRDGRNVNV